MEGTRIKTFVLLFHAADINDYCRVSKPAIYLPMEESIQETIDKYCSEKNVVECDRKITTTLCEGNGSFVVTITSKFESNSELKTKEDSGHEYKK